VHIEYEDLYDTIAFFTAYLYGGSNCQSIIENARFAGQTCGILGPPLVISAQLVARS
jgi:hypothetical protein